MRKGERRDRRDLDEEGEIRWDEMEKVMDNLITFFLEGKESSRGGRVGK